MTHNVLKLHITERCIVFGFTIQTTPQRLLTLYVDLSKHALPTLHGKPEATLSI